jgi:hypothetical protein
MPFLNLLRITSLASLAIFLTACGSQPSVSERRVGTSYSSYLVGSGHQPKESRDMGGGEILYYFVESEKYDHIDYTCMGNKNSSTTNGGTTVNVNSSSGCKYFTDEACNWAVLVRKDGIISAFNVRKDSHHGVCRHLGL